MTNFAHELAAAVADETDRPRVWFVDELPKGPTGKVLKREIELPASG